MLAPTPFRDLVSGRRRGPGAALLRAALALASRPYGWAVAVRNSRYDRGVAPVVRPPTPVISVGNLTVGGTGKTPLVEWLARWFAAREVRVALLSRGYGAGRDGRNDEARELHLALPGVPHLQNPDRAAAAVEAVDRWGAQALILDDGFQHRRLARDLDIVLLDASEPFGFDRLLPRGTLREPVEGLRRAGVVVLSRADMIPPAQRDAIRRRVAAIHPGAAWCEVEHRPARLLAPDGAAESLERLRGATVVAFCGIGNPAGFRHTVQGLGCRVAAWREFPDHHLYAAGDVAEVAGLVRDTGAAFALCTRKDLVKLPEARLGDAALRAVSIELAVREGQAALEAALAPWAEQARRASSAARSVSGPSGLQSR